MLEVYVLAAIAGWVVDDWCPTPPRPPIPWPGPWPWLRKGLAVLGAIGAVVVFGDMIGPDYGPVATIAAGGIGGAFLASIGTMIFGNMRQPTAGNVR